MTDFSRRFRPALETGTRRLLAKVWPLGIVAAAICAPAHAEGPGGASGNHCSRLGPDFVQISGAQRCVRLGGHVRAEAPRTEIPRVPESPRFPSPMGYAAAAADGLRPASETFHVRAGAGTMGAGLYRR